MNLKTSLWAGNRNDLILLVKQIRENNGKLTITAPGPIGQTKLIRTDVLVSKIAS